MLSNFHPSSSPVPPLRLGAVRRLQRSVTEALPAVDTKLPGALLSPDDADERTRHALAFLHFRGARP